MDTGFFFQLTQIQGVFYDYSALGFCLHCRLEYAVGTSVLIWSELPKQVPLWQQRPPRGLSRDISLYTLQQGFSTCLPMGGIVHLPLSKCLVGFIFFPLSTLTITYNPEVTISVKRVSDSLTWGQSCLVLPFFFFVILEDNTWVPQEWSKLDALFLPAFRRQRLEDT